MPTIAEVREKFPQYNDMSDVELAGALHNRFYSDMPPDQFAEKIGLKPDKYTQAAIEERAALDNPGDAGLTRRLAHGATLGADNTVIAAALTPFEMLKRGTLDPREGYNYAKAREDLIMDEARKNTGIAGSAAELLGGGVAGAGLARGGVTTGRFLSAQPGLLGRTASSAADAAALGGVAGFNEGNGLNERMTNAGSGALIGGAIGGVMPVAGMVTKAVASPFISNIMAQLDPEGFARRQVARAFTESGRPVSDVVGDVVQAGNEGQGVYTVADALGNSGQRMLSSVARAPGAGRTAAVDALEARQGTQGRRVSNALAEGFETPQTAAQTEARMTSARDAVADAEYGAVRADARPVDLGATIAHIDNITGPPSPHVANDSVEQVLGTFRNRMSRLFEGGEDNLANFEAVQRVRGDLSDAIQKARRAGEGNKARLLGQVMNRLDNAMEAASEGHRAANRNFAQASRDIEAVQAGREAATQGRTEDTIPRYQALTPEGQAAFRSGYVDPLIANTQGAAFGVNKARPLLNDAFAAEAEAMAPGNALLQRRLGREQRMFETRAQALGGSKTADNLADADALGIDPSVVGHVLSGNYGAAAKSLIAAGSNAVTGNTPAVREAVGNLLLRNASNVTGANFERMITETIKKIQMVQDMARNAGRAVTGAVAVAPSATKKPKPSIFKKADR
jgi:hypothetical protein